MMDVMYDMYDGVDDDVVFGWDVIDVVFVCFYLG